MSACTCNHVESDHGRYTHTAMCHCAFTPAATERTTTVTDNLTPADLARFVYPVPVGATIPGGTEWVNRETPSMFTGPHVRRNDFQSGPNTPRWTAEPIEPPEPALPTEPGAVVLADGTPWTRGVTGWWSLDSTQSLSLVKMAEKDWVLAKIVPADDPTAPKADDGLRERVEKLAEYYKLGGVYALPPAEVYAHLRSILLTDGADQ